MNKIAPLACIRQYYGYILLVCFLIGLKALHRVATTDQLLWLLTPLSSLVELYGKAQFAYVPQGGYWDQSQEILLDKSCSGFNFLLIMFAVLFVTWIPAQTQWNHLLRRVLPILGLAYGLSILVNAGRIVCILSFQARLENWGFSSATAHEMLGVFIFWGSLLFIYHIIQRIPIKQ